jgi:hypothetical protein
MTSTTSKLTSLAARPGLIGLLLKAVGLALVLVPWFLRDQVAVELDSISRAAVVTQGRLQAQIQKQESDKDQRRLTAMVASIEVTVDIMNGDRQRKDGDARKLGIVLEAINKDMDALKKAANGFKVELDKLQLADLTKEDRTALVELADAVVAHASKVQAAIKTDKLGELDDLLADADEAEGAITKVYAQLEDDIEKMKQSTADEASSARKLAWILTAFGAALMGDWRRALNVVTGDDGDGSAEPDAGDAHASEDAARA